MNVLRRSTLFAALAPASLVVLFATTAEAQAQPQLPAPPDGPQEPLQPPPPVADPAPILPAPPVTPVTPVTPVAPGDPGPIATNDAKTKELENRIAIDEARLTKLEDEIKFFRHLKFEGYVQLEYRNVWNNAAASPNLVNGRLPNGVGSDDVIAKADGTTSNLDTFRMRRTRLRTWYETDVTQIFLQLDFLPAGGPTGAQGSVMRNAEAYGIANWSKHAKTYFGGGLFMHPFRYEVTEPSMFRPFLERTWAEANLFPFERDIGVRAKTVIDDALTVDVGVTNGHRLGESTFVLAPDLDHGKEPFAVVTYKAGPVTVGLHGLYGTNVLVDPQALRVKNFERKGANLSAVFKHPFFPKLGETRAIGEIMVGENMDTGIRYAFGLPAIPTNFRDDVKDLGERGLYVRFEQELTEWAIAGFRYDMYTPNTQIANNARDSYDFMVGARFGKWFHVTNEVTYAIDNVHAEGAPPPSKQIWQNSLWLQGAFY